MATITVDAGNDRTFEFTSFRGLSFPSFISKSIKEGYGTHVQLVKDFTIRDDDVYLATYPKSGTHWMWEIIQMLRRGSTEYEKDKKMAAFLDLKQISDIDDLPSPRVLNCHYPVNLMPKQLLEKGTKIVHVLRNPKDVAVSFFNHINTLAQRAGEEPIKFSEYLPLFTGHYGIYLFRSWANYEKDWERFQKNNPEQVLTIYYEDMKENLPKEIKKIDSFLGYNRDHDLYTEIAEACSFQKLKAADKAVKQGEPGFGDLNFLYRKGEVGDWKNWFSVAENEMFDTWLEENLVDTELKFKYTL